MNIIKSVKSVQSDVGKAPDIILVTALMGKCTQAGRHVCFPLLFMGHNLEGLPAQNLAIMKIYTKLLLCIQINLGSVDTITDNKEAIITPHLRD